MPTHYLNQCSLIVHRTLRNKLQWNLNRNSKIFIEENAFESIVCEMVAILFRGRWVNHWLGHWSTAPHPVLLHMVFFSMSVLADPEKDQAYPIKYKFRPLIDNSLITPFRKILPPHSKWRLPCWWPHRNLLTHKFTYCKLCLFQFKSILLMWSIHYNILYMKMIKNMLQWHVQKVIMVLSTTDCKGDMVISQCQILICSRNHKFYGPQTH